MTIYLVEAVFALGVIIIGKWWMTRSIRKQADVPVHHR
jgi:hypothetical protein